MTDEALSAGVAAAIRPLTDLGIETWHETRDGETMILLNSSSDTADGAAVTARSYRQFLIQEERRKGALQMSLVPQVEIRRDAKNAAAQLAVRIRGPQAEGDILPALDELVSSSMAQMEVTGPSSLAVDTSTTKSLFEAVSKVEDGTRSIAERIQAKFSATCVLRDDKSEDKMDREEFEFENPSQFLWHGNSEEAVHVCPSDSLVALLRPNGSVGCMTRCGLAIYANSDTEPQLWTYLPPSVLPEDFALLGSSRDQSREYDILFGHMFRIACAAGHAHWNQDEDADAMLSAIIDGDDDWTPDDFPEGLRVHGDRKNGVQDTPLGIPMTRLAKVLAHTSAVLAQRYRVNLDLKEFWESGSEAPGDTKGTSRPSSTLQATSEDSSGAEPAPIKSWRVALVRTAPLGVPYLPEKHAFDLMLHHSLFPISTEEITSERCFDDADD